MKKTWLWWIPPAIFALLSRLPDFIYWLYKPEDLYGFFNKTLSFISSITDPIWSAVTTVFSWIWIAVSFTVPVPLSLLIPATIVFAWLLYDLYMPTQEPPEEKPGKKRGYFDDLEYIEAKTVMYVYQTTSEREVRNLLLEDDNGLDNRMIDQLFDRLVEKGYIVHRSTPIGGSFLDLTRKGRDDAIKLKKQIQKDTEQAERQESCP